MMRRARKLSVAHNYTAFTSLLFQCCIAACSSPRTFGFKSAPIVRNMFHVRHLGCGARRYSTTSARRWRYPKRSHRPIGYQYFASCMNHKSTGSSRQEFLKATSSKVLSTSFAIAMADSIRQAPVADAFCGKPYPRWAYFVNFDEVLVPFTFEGYSGKLFVRTVGNEKDQNKAKHNPLVVIPGGPGLPHDYLETLEGAAFDNRVVVTFDPIGTGNSSALPTDADLGASSDLLGTPSLVAQTKAALEYLKLSTYHILGHGTAAAAALEIARVSGRSGPRAPGSPDRGEAVLSVTLASPILGGSALPADFLGSLRAQYTERGDETPQCLETAIERTTSDVFSRSLAALKKSGAAGGGALGPLACPTLITYGSRDVIEDQVVQKLEKEFSGGTAPVKSTRFEGSGHLPHLDDREDYVQLVQDFVNEADSAWAGTSGSKK